MINFDKIKICVLAMMLIAVTSIQPVSAEDVMSDPCPIPEEKAGENPLDLADVQSDIDILKLCVERANLLKTLNNLVKDPKEDMAEQKLKTLNNKTKKLANDDLFELPDFNEEETGNKLTDNIGTMVNEDGSMAEPVKPKKQAKPTEPTLVNIFGNTKTGITADVKTTDGLLKRVTVGDTIEKGIVVKEISTQGVVVLKEGNDLYLKWE